MTSSMGTQREEVPNPNPNLSVPRRRRRCRRLGSGWPAPTKLAAGSYDDDDGAAASFLPRAALNSERPWKPRQRRRLSNHGAHGAHSPQLCFAPRAGGSRAKVGASAWKEAGGRQRREITKTSIRHFRPPASAFFLNFTFFILFSGALVSGGPSGRRASSHAIEMPPRSPGAVAAATAATVVRQIQQPGHDSSPAGAAAAATCGGLGSGRARPPRPPSARRPTKTTAAAATADRRFVWPPTIMMAGAHRNAERSSRSRWRRRRPPR